MGAAIVKYGLPVRKVPHSCLAAGPGVAAALPFHRPFASSPAPAACQPSAAVVVEVVAESAGASRMAFDLGHRNLQRVLVASSLNVFTNTLYMYRNGSQKNNQSSPFMFQRRI